MAISSAAIVLSTIALSEAEQAKTVTCKLLVSNYEAKTATVTQMHEYSDCVSHLYPQPQEISPDIIIALKIILVLCAIGGVIFSFKAGYTGIVEAFMEFMLGALVTLGCGGAIAGVVAGFIWVVS